VRGKKGRPKKSGEILCTEVLEKVRRIRELGAGMSRKLLGNCTRKAVARSRGQTLKGKGPIVGGRKSSFVPKNKKKKFGGGKGGAWRGCKGKGWRKGKRKLWGTKCTRFLRGGAVFSGRGKIPEKKTRHQGLQRRPAGHRDPTKSKHVGGKRREWARGDSEGEDQ